MSTSGGSSSGGGGLTPVTNVAGDTLTANTWTRVTAAANGTVTLPTAPANGTQMRVEFAGNYPHVLTIAAGGSDTFDTGVTFLTQRTIGVFHDLVYYSAGAVWQVANTNPQMIPWALTTSVRGTSATPGSIATQWMSRETNRVTGGALALAYPSPWPFTVPSGANNGATFSMLPPYYSSSLTTSVEVGAIVFAVFNATGTNKLLLSTSPSTFPAPHVPTIIPGQAGVGLLGTWTTTESIGTDLAVSPDGKSIDSTAGGQYYISSYWTISTVRAFP